MHAFSVHRRLCSCCCRAPYQPSSSHSLPPTAPHALPAPRCPPAPALPNNHAYVQLSARGASDGSLKLYLCIMLRKAPLVTWAVVDGLGGDRFASVYLPALGCE